MLLEYQFDNRELNRTLDLFLEMIVGLLGQRLVSVVLYGSVVFDDLAPRYGDLDFLAVIDGDISDRMARELVELRKPLREGRHGILGEMIEGAFLPRRMLNLIAVALAVLITSGFSDPAGYVPA